MIKGVKRQQNLTSKGKGNNQDQDVGLVLTRFISKMYQNESRGYDTKTFQTFGVPIGNAKITIKYSST